MIAASDFPGNRADLCYFVPVKGDGNGIRVKRKDILVKTRFSLLSLFLLLLVSLPFAAFAQDETDTGLTIESGDVEVTSGGQNLQSYLAAPTEGGPYPGIVLVH